VSERLIVCKSMSKVYALSGLRVAYLVTSPGEARALRLRTPPWAVGLPGQIAAVRALESPEYYRGRWTETRRLAFELAQGLEAIGGLEVIRGVANFLLFHLAPQLPAARTLVARCRAHGLYLRDAAAMGASLGDRAVRIAVRDQATNARMVEILKKELVRHASA
jgi:histidinol-phosphate/aromatic aminotransferase/cobyric acid decarboxylase-like protein